ncbi:MAG: sodium-dependent bicarbonate transport family permease [Chloroflexi bacterium]|nr:sodium-dependent bicarbonate transport family permease [Chloroflexota bacterium]
MDTWEIIRVNVFSPMVLAFALGVVAQLLKSDLKLPEQIYSGIAMYLLFSIGLKGGFGLARAPLESVIAPALATLMLGVGIPLWCYALLRLLGKFDVANAAALAAHYGSVSAVTFSASITLLDELRLPYEAFLPTLVALLEIPAIAVALLIAQQRLGGHTWQKALHEVLTGKSIFLLIGGVVIGFISGEPGYQQVSPLFTTLFAGLLTLFLLEMGVVTGQYLRALRQVGAFLIGFGIVMPLLHGALGVWLGTLSGLSLGGSMALGAMAASASYIAAPAAVRVALPQANPSYYLTAAIAITFPFNLIFGLPLYLEIARALHAAG